jgi:hypothetical protein
MASVKERNLGKIGKRSHSEIFSVWSSNLMMCEERRDGVMLEKNTEKKINKKSCRK